MNKFDTKALTTGAMFAAIYGLLVLLTRYFLTSSDSLLYYIFPLPLALYAYKYNLKSSIITFIVIILISFIFGNPIYVLLLMLPNYLIGLSFGLLERKITNKKINYIIIFILCFIADIFSVFAYELITSVSYFSDIDPLLKIFDGFIDTDFLKQTIKLLLISVLIIDSLFKTIILYMLFYLIGKRIKMVDKIDTSLIKISFNPFIDLIFVLAVIFMSIILKIGYENFGIIYQSLFVVFITIITLLMLYMMYQWIFYLSLYCLYHSKRKLYIFLAILSVILFPISAFIGFILNIVYYKKKF